MPHRPTPSKTFTVTIIREGSMSFIPIEFDPRPVFGKLRAAVRVTLNGYSFRSTIASMGGGTFIPLRRSNREAAGLVGGETITVRLDLDTAERVVALPTDLRRAVGDTPGGLAAWNALSYTRRREHVEAVVGAKKPETRARRIQAALATLRQTAPRRTGAPGTSKRLPSKNRGPK